MSRLKTSNKIFLATILFIIMLLVVLLIGKFTYSYLGADLDENITYEGEVTANDDTLIFSKGNKLNMSATTDNFNLKSGNITDTTNPTVQLIANLKNDEASTTYEVGFKITNNTYTYSTTALTPELILTILDENGDELTEAPDLKHVNVNGITGFDITGLVGEYIVMKDYPISTTSKTEGTKHTWTFTLTFINLESDQAINENASLKMDVFLQTKQENVLLKDRVLADGTKEESLVEVDKDLSYRYVGKNPSNYVCFGSYQCSLTSNYNNLYRIIGVFGNQVKLVKADYLENTELKMDVKQEVITNLLGYEGNLSSLTGYTYSGTEVLNNNWAYSKLRVALNDEENGFLSNFEAPWLDKIASSSWTIGGVSSLDYAVNDLYDYELGANKITLGEQKCTNEVGDNATSICTDNDLEVTDKVGLMYASDYGYAAVKDNWQDMVSTYNNEQINVNNWLYMGVNEWLLTRNNTTPSEVFTINKINDEEVTNTKLVRPTFYLNGKVTYVSGTGSIRDPYIIN